MIFFHVLPVYLKSVRVSKQTISTSISSSFILLVTFHVLCYPAFFLNPKSKEMSQRRRNISSDSTSLTFNNSVPFFRFFLCIICHRIVHHSVMEIFYFNKESSYIISMLKRYILKVRGNLISNIIKKGR